MEKETRLFTRVMILGVGSAVSKATIFLLMPLYTRLLTPADFGTADLLVSGATLLLPLLTLEAPEAIFRFLAGKGEERSIVQAGLKMVGAGAVFTAVLFPFLALIPFFRPFLALLSLYVLSAAWHKVTACVLRARGEYGFFATQQCFCTFLAALLAFLFLSTFRLSVRGYLVSILLSDAITALLLTVYLFKTRKGKTENVENPLSPMLRYALPLIPSAALWWIFGAVGRYVLLYTHGRAETGIFAAAMKIPAVLSFAAGIFMEAWQYSAVRAGKDPRALFGRIFASFASLLLLFTVFLVLFSRVLAAHLFADGFANAAAFLPFLLIGAFCGALSSFFISTNMVKLRSFVSLETAGIGAAFAVLASFFLIPAQGVAGAVAATVISEAALLVLRALIARRVLSFPQPVFRFSISFLFLFLCALLAAREKGGLSAVFGLTALLPFSPEYFALFHSIMQYGKNFFKIRQKNAN